MPQEHEIDLSMALNKFHELGLAEGDLGYAHWHQVARLLERAVTMQTEIDALSKQFEICRTKLARIKVSG
ncbi:hypothetical protein PHO31112_02336 [Pandoraea horticolens]|uniref:Uncharacterized protein n=1 Tax=Pandoraea horticolens TaxID=2508298 RepID=A0A5E4V0V4_9BURK|nr:hypothetical protein [Pandoraea horticolens]VVE05009.1 hypothetical protein PHO31112_02336 [Pandoraea horticolens]